MTAVTDRRSHGGGLFYEQDLGPLTTGSDEKPDELMGRQPLNPSAPMTSAERSARHYARHREYPLMCGCRISFLSAEAIARSAAVLTLTIAAAQAYGMYDGTYRGNLIGIGNNATGCTKIAPAQMTVSDDKRR